MCKNNQPIWSDGAYLTDKKKQNYLAKTPSTPRKDKKTPLQAQYFYLNFKLVGYVLPLISLMTLSACSNLQNKVKTKAANAKVATSSTANRLHKEANDYQYSSYVRQNLKPRKPSQATVNRYSTFSSRDYTMQQLQLKQRKKRSNVQIRLAVFKNGLYRPTQRTQRQLSALQGRQSHQAWLEGHSSLNDILALALKNNLDIKSQQQSALTNLSKYDQVSYLDDMLRQYSAFTNDLTLSGSTQKHRRSTNVAFPFPGVSALKASIINQSVEVARLKLKQTVQEVITKTRLAYYELQYSQHNIDLTLQMGKLLVSLKEELENNYAVNSGKLGDILQVDIEVEENKNDVQIAKDKQQAQQARLNALLNLPQSFKLTKLDPLTPIQLPNNSYQLIQIAKKRRIEIANLQAELEKLQRVIHLSDRRFYPDFDAGYSRFQNSMSKQIGSNANRAAFSNRPNIKSSNFFATNDAYLTESKDKAKALQAKIKALKIQTEDELQQIYTRYQSQQRTYALYQTKILPKAKSALDIAKNNFETGASSFMEIMQTQEAIFRYRLLAFNAVKEMNMKVAKIWRIMGSGQ